MTLPFHTKLGSEISRHRSNPRILLRSNSIAQIRDFVVQGRGISFLTWFDVWADVEAGRLEFAEINNRRLTDSLRICTVSGLRQEAVVRHGLQALVEALAQIEAKK